MLGRLRSLPPEALVEVASRALRGRGPLRLSLRPGALLIGVLARAQRRTGMGVCAFVQLPNQGHLLLRPIDVEQLALFMAHVHSNVAGSDGRRGGGCKRSRRTRRPDVVLGHAGRGEERRLRFLLTEAMKAGLAAPLRASRANGWAAGLAWGGELRGVWVNASRLRGPRSPRGLRASRPYSYREVLELAPLPSWDGLTSAQRLARARCLIGKIEEDVALALGGTPTSG